MGERKYFSGTTETPGLQPLKVLFLQQSSIHTHKGGIETYQDGLQSLIANKFGKDNLVVLSPNRDSKPKLLENSDYYSLFIPFILPKPFAFLENRLPLYFLYRAWRIGRLFKPDLIIIGHLRLSPITFILSLLLRTPWAVCLHGIEVWNRPDPITSFFLKLASHFFTSSENTRETLIKREWEPDKITTLHPVLPRAFRYVPYQYFPERTPLTLLTVGRLDKRERYKGHDDTLLALYNLKLRGKRDRYRYKILGSGSDKSRLQQKTKSLGLEGYVEFVAEDDLQTLYRSCDLYVMPARFGYLEKKWRGEGFGITYLEAAAMSLPILAYRCGGVTDWVSDHFNGILVEPDNVEQLTMALEKLDSDRALLRKLSENAYHSAQFQFSERVIEKQFLMGLDQMQMGGTPADPDHILSLDHLGEPDTETDN